MADPKSRARVERLLRGDIRTDDITNLFLYARDRCDGRESVQEVGDFVAHHSERTKGIVTRTTRDWSAICRFVSGRFGPGGPFPLDASNLPDITPHFLQASLRRLTHAIIMAQFGMSKAEVARTLPHLLKKLHPNKTGGGLELLGVTHKELEVFRCLTSFLSVQGAFDGEQLCVDFIATLKSNGLISKEEIRNSPQVGAIVQLFAFSVMHNCEIVDTDGAKIRLYGVSKDVASIGRRLAIDAAVPTHNIGQPNQISMVSSIYQTTLDAAYCSDALRATSDWRTVQIELTASGKLDIMI
jgi:hypothetical protein